MGSIKFVYFDFGGVMAHWKPGVTKFSELFGKAEQDIFASLYRHFPDAARGLISTNEMWRRVKEDLSVDHNHHDYAAHFAEFFVPIPETHEFARELKKNYRVGILSNIEPDTLSHAISHGHMGDIDFDLIIESHATGHIKPEAKIYEYAEQQAGVRPEEILFIDDLQENVVGAREAGWHVQHFDSFNPGQSIQAIRTYLQSN